MKPKRKVLKNGLRTLLIPLRDTQAVTVMVLVGSGAEHEKPNEHGIAHFLEHMCFKGPEKRPNSIDITRELESLGAQTNAMTSRRYTGYYAKALSKHTHKVLDVVADLYLNPVFPVAELEKEKGVVIEEINMYDDMPQALVELLFEDTLYGKGSIHGHSILGTKGHITSFTQADLKAFRKRNYTAENTVVIVSGDFDEKNVSKDIEALFADIPQGAVRGIKKAKPSKGPTVALHTKKSEQTHLVLGVPAFGKSHKDVYALNMLTTVLGGSMSSRLFRKLREEMGVCYYVGAHPNTYVDYGSLTIHAGVPKDRLDEVVREIHAELQRLTIELVPDDELTLAKNYVTGGVVLGLESSHALAQYYGKQEVVGLPLATPTELLAQYKKVTAGDIRRVAKKLFSKEHYTLALVGPVKDTQKYRRILSQ